MRFFSAKFSRKGVHVSFKPVSYKKITFVIFLLLSSFSPIQSRANNLHRATETAPQAQMLLEATTGRGECTCICGGTCVGLDAPWWCGVNGSVICDNKSHMLQTSDTLTTP